MDIIEKRRKLAEIRAKAQKLNEAESFGEQEQAQFDGLMGEARTIQAWLERNEQVAALPALENSESRQERAALPQGAPVHHQRPTKDHPEAILCRYIRTGDELAMREMRAASREQYRNGDYIKHPFGKEQRYNPWVEVYQQLDAELRASNDTTMNVGTAADGGNLVPTGHYNRIIARRDEGALREKLSLMPIPGRGTTVNVPIDNEADGEFVLTGEQTDGHTNNFDRDAPAVDKVQNTLLKYTKKIELTDELLEDNDSNLLQWIEFRLGVGLGKTDNNLIVTEALANGTAALTLDAAASVTAAEVPELIYLQAEGYEDGSNWLMRRTSVGHFMQKTGNIFQFVPTPVSGSRSQLFGFPVHTTSKMPAIGAGNKSLIFGNFSFMGYRQMPGLTMLRDPYSVDGMTVLKYYYRVDYNVLQAAAIIYATHPTA